MKPLTTLFLLLSLTTSAQIKMPFGSHGDSIYVWVSADTLVKGHTLAPGYAFRDSDKTEPTYTQFIAPILITLPNGHHSYMNMDSTWHVEDTLLTIKTMVKWQMEIRRNYDNKIDRLYKIIAIQKGAINKTLGILNRQRKLLKKKK